MTNIIDRKGSKLIEFLSIFNEQFSYEKICELNEQQKEHYANLLNKFEKLNKATTKDKKISNLHNKKGEALEELVDYLLKISGHLFVVKRNLRTSTNEIDDLITLTPAGNALLNQNLINKRLKLFLGECKNYNKRLSVTYVGKFCSLLLTNNIHLGILFSYHGVSGSNWSNAAGLIKKFYLHKENEDERFCIIDFSINEFKSILNGENLLNIIDKQLEALRIDTDYHKDISKHPAE